MALRSVASRSFVGLSSLHPGMASAAPTAGCGLNRRSFPPLASSGLRSVLDQGYGHTFGYLRTSSTLSKSNIVNIFVEEETKCGNEVNYNDQALTPQETRKFMQQVSSFLSSAEKSHERMITLGLESNAFLQQIRDGLTKIPKSSPKPAGYEALLVVWGFKPPEHSIWRKLWLISFVTFVLLAQSFLSSHVRYGARFVKRRFLRTVLREWYEGLGT